MSILFGLEVSIKAVTHFCGGAYGQSIRMIIMRMVRGGFLRAELEHFQSRREIRACDKTTWTRWRPDLGRIWTERLRKCRGIARLWGSVFDRGTFKDGPKMGGEMFKLFCHRPLALQRRACPIQEKREEEQNSISSHHLPLNTSVR